LIHASAGTPPTGRRRTARRPARGTEVENTRTALSKMPDITSVIDNRLNTIHRGL
jgi:hypothetical protein